MIFRREIPKIGQGSFIEQIMDINDQQFRIIYDCGSYQKNVLKNYIDLMDKSIPTLLVVSHLHEDHINCVPYLFSAGINVKRIVIPDLTENIKKAFAASFIEHDLDTFRFIFTPESFTSNVSFVQKKNENLQDNDTIDIVNARYFINDNDVFFATDFFNFWCIKFWVDEKIYKNLTKIENDKINNIRIEDFNDKKRFSEIHKVYDGLSQKYKEKLNRTSMMMGTFLKPYDLYQYSRGYSINTRFYRESILFHDIGFICTGDYPIIELDIVKDIAYHFLKESIQFKEMQIPHHGSDKYFEYLPFPHINRAYAQTTKTKKYKHPGQSTINFLKKNGIYFRNIEEN